MDKNSPIGIFDSGVGGISVLNRCIELMPNENYIFLGDDIHCPYGEKSDAEIIELTYNALVRLMEMGVKALVIACNTATAAAVDEMRKRISLPIVGIEPAVKPASEAKGKGRILVIATPATVRQKRFRTLLERLNIAEVTDAVPCPGLAALIEKNFGEPDDAVTRYLSERFGNIIKEDYAAVVLGCTHYSFISEEVQRFFPDAQIYNGDYGEARQLKRLLVEKALENAQGGQVKFIFSSGDGKSLEVAQKFFKKNPKK